MVDHLAELSGTTNIQIIQIFKLHDERNQSLITDRRSDDRTRSTSVAVRAPTLSLTYICTGTHSVPRDPLRVNLPLPVK
jgi:hypothetical protein